MQLQLVDAGYIIEAQELELFKSEYVCHNQENMVKLEDDKVFDYVHPRIAEIRVLLKSAKSKKKLDDFTKTSCALRAAISHTALQKTAPKKCIHCQKELRVVKYHHRKLVYYMSAASIKSR